MTMIPKGDMDAIHIRSRKATLLVSNDPHDFTNFIDKKQG